MSRTCYFFQIDNGIYEDFRGMILNLGDALDRKIKDVDNGIST